MARGIGLLESFRYGEARASFRRAIELAPDWTDAKINYVIALLNSTADETEGGDLAGEAVRLARETLAKEPENDALKFLLGFLLLHRGEDPEESLRLLRSVREPDAAVHFWIGRGEADRGRLEEAIRAYDDALALDRHLVSAWYGRFSCLNRLGRREEAEKAKAEWDRLRAGGARNVVSANSYPEIGRLALAVRRYAPAKAEPRSFEWRRVEGGDLASYRLPAPGQDARGDSAPPGPPVPGQGARGDSAPLRPPVPPCIALGDVDDDGDLDLYLPGALFENLGDLRFRKKAALPPMAGLFLDWDGDERTDLYLYGEEGDELRRGVAEGGLRGLGGAGGRFALSADLDMDGDVDLFVTRDGEPCRLLRNNRDGTFTAIDVGGAHAARGAIVADFDRDRDPDLLVAVAEGPPRRLRNDRADGFLEIGPAALPPGVALVAADLDRDGAEEVRTIGFPLLLADADLDGRIDEVARPGLRTATAADLDGDGTPEILGIDAEGAVRLEKASVAAGRWIALDLRGGKNLAGEPGAPPAGPGSAVEILSGGVWQMHLSRSVSGFAAQQPPWITFGTGGNEIVDVLRILWPDQVLQAELDLPTNARKVLRQVNRKPSSCPLLFADGPGGTRFLTDFLGSGGLGFFLAPGLFGKPDPDEVIFVGDLEPAGGEYLLRVLEPLEEVSYLDEATLLAVDHPEGVEVLPNERFAGEEPFPEFRIWEIARRVAPARAFHSSGADVTAEIAAVDRRYPPVPLDPRFEGFAREHWVAFDFAGLVPRLSGGERLLLLLDGWVEYGYSHSNFAAGQAGVALFGPSLELREGDAWRTAIAATGYPAGLPRTMTLDVTGVVTPERPLFRLRTNLEVYWDRVTLGVDRGEGRARVHRLAPSRAELRERGYPREYSPDGALPRLYDYGLLDPGYPFKLMGGDYTRFGDVTPLLEAADDRYVIFGKGDEVTLRYDAAALPVPTPETRRTFLLYAAGWCKDMDPYTAFPETVEPLPFRAMSNYPCRADEGYPDDEPHARYRREWNTRRVPSRFR